jgi:hypothetical protein
MGDASQKRAKSYGREEDYEPEPESARFPWNTREQECEQCILKCQGKVGKGDARFKHSGAILSFDGEPELIMHG